MGERRGKSAPGRRCGVGLLVAAVMALLAGVLSAASAGAATVGAHTGTARHGREQLAAHTRPALDPAQGGALRRDCPWVTASFDHRSTPAQLAAEVVARMTVAEKAEFVVLVAHDGSENINAGIPQLCIPPLTLSDGPDGIAYHTPGVTQLPASIGVAASFDPGLAYTTGQVEGAEARTKGIDVVQGPELNLARVPESGRIFEAYGEDPELTGAMGAANAEGIQSQGVMANAKHLSAYNEETARILLDQDVSLRALAELYDAPFLPVVRQAHVASIMCSYGSINGINTCSDPLIYSLLRSWGFKGFVRSDLGSVYDPPQAFSHGLDLIKPGSVSQLVQAVRHGHLSTQDLDDAVSPTLTEMFAYGLVAHPRQVDPGARATTPAHTQVALEAAERSMVLLRDRAGVLPLERADRSVAVIGSDAGPEATTTGYGSSHVLAPFVSTPLAALHAALPQGTRISYVPADAPSLAAPTLTSSDLIAGSPLPARTPTHLPSVPPAGTPPGARTRVPAPTHNAKQPRPRPSGHVHLEPGKGDLHIDLAPNVTPAAATASTPGTGPGWSAWQAVLEVKHTGTYVISLAQDGDTWLYLDGRQLMASKGLHGRAVWAVTTQLVAGQHYTLGTDWFAPLGQPFPQVGLDDVSPEIAAAVKAARQASVALVFVSVGSSEGVDRPDLSLPGDADALISAVAAANPRTVVVVNSGSAVLMPWIDHVAGVVEAWYPGEEDGVATAAVLTGAVDPGGHLPLTFPATDNRSPLGTPAQFPGVDATVHYTEGLDIGYRWYQAKGVTPLFPFGFGLSYTSFRVSDAGAGPALRLEDDRVVATVTATNTGRRTGTCVVQAYVGYPRAAGEPPLQLRGFRAVRLAAGQSATVHLVLPERAFQAYLGGRFHTVAGTYRVDIGQSSANLPVRLTTALVRA